MRIDDKHLTIDHAPKSMDARFWGRARLPQNAGTEYGRYRLLRAIAPNGRLRRSGILLRKACTLIKKPEHHALIDTKASSQGMMLVSQQACSCAFEENGETTNMAPIVVVSSTHERLADFIGVLQAAAGTPIQLATTAEAALAAAREAPPVLMVIDQLIDLPVFALVKKIMTVNALIHTAVISEQSADAFHDTAEGLGILMQLPNPPGNADASALWKRLIDIGAAS